MAPSSPLRKPPTAKNPSQHHSGNCLDIPIFVTVLCSVGYLIFSVFSYLSHSLSLILPPFSTITAQFHHHWTSNPHSQTIFFALFFAFVLSVEICCACVTRSRMCEKKGCRGLKLKKSMETELRLQAEELLRAGDENEELKELKALPWKGGSKDSPEYEDLRADLRKMAPPNGRAVLLFRDRCGCPVAKLEGWGHKRGRRNKKGLARTSGGDQS